jgi:hypothetical protein
MIAIVNKTKLSSWEYSYSNQRGYISGFKWMLALSAGKYNYYKLIRHGEGRPIFIELSTIDKNKSVKDLIEDYINKNFDALVIDWMIKQSSRLLLLP